MTHTYDHQQSLIANMASMDSIESTERNSDLKKVQYMQETREFQSADALEGQIMKIKCLIAIYPKSRFPNLMEITASVPPLKIFSRN